MKQKGYFSNPVLHFSVHADSINLNKSIGLLVKSTYLLKNSTFLKHTGLNQLLITAIKDEFYQFLKMWM